MGIIKSNKKKIIGALAILSFAICGAAAYLLNEDKSEKERVAMNMKNQEVDSVVPEVEAEDSEEKKAEENNQPKVDETSNVKVEEKKEEPKETPKTNKSTENKQPQKEQSKPAEHPEKSENKVTSYTSQGLGISFDFPGSWNEKYVIKDNGDSLSVYMKHSRNDEGLGLLFIITTNAEDAPFLDAIGRINKEQTLNGRKLFVGGPTGYSMIENDPLEKQYREMLSQRSEVLRTLR